MSLYDKTHYSIVKVIGLQLMKILKKKNLKKKKENTYNLC